MNNPKSGSGEISPTEGNRHANEVPMPEQQTGDVEESQRLAGRHSDDATPDHPPSERA
jgi:hypothetical protein